MRITVNDNIPNGFPLVQYENRDYYEPMEQLKAIFNLRHSVFDKIKAAPKLTHAMRSDIKDIFSKEDISILECIHNDNRLSTETKSFIKFIIKKNIVRYTDSPLKKASEILNLTNLKEQYPQEKYSTFTKWFSISSFGQEKIDTIINDKIYMPFPLEFNDRFDSQLHLNEQEMLLLGNSNKVNVPFVKYLDLLTKYIINVSSFSLNEPLSTNSNHMWGLYGDNGKGFSLTYELDHLIAQVLSNNSPDKSIHEFLFFKPVNYIEKYSPNKDFKVCLDHYYGKNQKDALINFFEKFAISKTPQWQFEKELRFYRYSFEVYKKFAFNHNTPVNEELCNNLLEHIELTKNKINHQIAFNRPTVITLGWNCDTNDSKIKQLIQYAIANSIKIIKLDEYINYSKDQFYYNIVY